MRRPCASESELTTHGRRSIAQFPVRSTAQAPRRGRRCRIRRRMARICAHASKEEHRHDLVSSCTENERPRIRTRDPGSRRMSHAHRPSAYRSSSVIMPVRAPRWAACRTVVAVAALYALALQAILGSALTVGLAGPAHQLCLQAVGGADEMPAKAPPAHNHLACCTAASHAFPFNAPAPAVTPIVWPQRRVARLVWRPEVVSIPRAPPGLRATARAPPVV